MHINSRRQFLWLTIGTGAPLGLGLCAWSRNAGTIPEGQAVAAANHFQAVRRTDWALGSEVTITALHQDADVAGIAVGAALAELRLVESLMSIYRPDSELSRLNRQGSLDDPHPYLVTVMREAIAMSRRSQGAFDMTVQPLWNLYESARQANRQPEEAAMRGDRKSVV